MIPIRIATVALIMMAFSIDSYAASFDCAKGKSRAEILVCSDSELSSLDDDLAKIYSKAKSLASSPAEFKAQGEREWKKRETTCIDKQCLLAWYSQRRDQLLSVINAQTSTPQPPPPKSSVDSALMTPKQNNAVAEKVVPRSSHEQITYQIIDTGNYGCIDKENFKRLRNILMQRDDATFLKEVTASAKKGECVKFNKGEKVYLEEGTVISSVIKIKKEGSSNSYWTATKAILTQPVK